MKLAGNPAPLACGAAGPTAARAVTEHPDARIAAVMMTGVTRRNVVFMRTPCSRLLPRRPKALTGWRKVRRSRLERPRTRRAVTVWAGARARECDHSHQARRRPRLRPLA